FALGNNLGSTDGYLATHSQIATKTSKPLLETSQTVSVITREQIGAWLMRVWDMPDDLYCALRFQQDPSYTVPNAVYANLICLTNQLLRNSGIGDGTQQAIPAALYERLG
ncbi:HDOD domain-containing protein, partial [Morganella morganii]